MRNLDQHEKSILNEQKRKQKDINIIILRPSLIIVGKLMTLFLLFKCLDIKLKFGSAR